MTASGIIAAGGARGDVKVSIIVVSWNTREALRSCLASIAASHGLSTEVYVVDNASADGSADMVARAFPSVQLIRNSENRGFATACNQAMRRGKGRFFLLLNSDAQVKEDGIARLVACLERDPDVGIVGPKYVYPDGRFQASFSDLPSLGREIVHALGLGRIVFGTHYPSYGPEESQRYRHVGWVPGTCMLVRASAADEVGLFDERFFLYSEEVDWCRRMASAGWLVAYCPAVEVRHALGESAKISSEESLFNLYNGRVLYAAKHGGRLHAWLLKLFIAGSLGASAMLRWLAAKSRRTDASAARARARVAMRIARQPINAEQ